MGLKKTIQRTEKINTSGLELNYHIIGMYMIDRRMKRASCNILSFVDREQCEASIIGGYSILPAYVFTGKDFETINSNSKKGSADDTMYEFIKHIKDNNLLFNAKDTLEK